MRASHLFKVFAMPLTILLFSCSGNTGEEPEKSAASGTTPVAVLQESRETQKTYFEDGAIKEEKNYLNGVLDGVSKEYYDNGKIKSERFYEGGKLITEHEKLYYYSGALLIERNYKHKKLHGVQRTFFDNGQLHEEVYFENGVQTGSSPRCFSNGQVRSECIHDDTTDEEICRDFYENGAVETESITVAAQRRLSSPKKTFHRNGALKTISNVLDGFGLQQQFYDNGILMMERIYKADDAVTINEYYTNGQLKSTRHFKKGKKDGRARFYDIDGALNTGQVWADGTLADELVFE